MHTPAFWYQAIGWKAVLLWPLTLLYWLGRNIQKAVITPESAPAFTICIGNLVAGGAGKTPIVLALTILLQQHGCKPQIVTRGYGGSQRKPKQVTSIDTAGLVGDEALLLAKQAPTWVAQDRLVGSGRATAAGASVILFDDGFQSVHLRATLNLLVVDGASGFGNGLLIPAGPLRELPKAALERTDAIILIGEDQHHVVKNFPVKSIFRADPHYLLKAIDLSVDYVAFAGLARPEKFFAAANALGFKVIETHGYADHHAYKDPDRQFLLSQAQAANARLLTTAKDAVRWPVADWDQLTILPLEMKFADPKLLLQWLLDKGL